MVLLALARASGWTTKRVPYEELVLQAWRDYPQTFSLRNHPEHPDASDIHKRLYQTLKPAGLIVSIGGKVFRLTEAGVRRAEQLEEGRRDRAPATDESDGQARLGREEQNFVNHASSSRAFETWKDGQADQLIDYDARMFFQFSTGTPKADRRRRVMSSRVALQKAAELGLPSSEELLELADFLATHFADLWEEGK
jgi:hypothetical protein